MKVLLDMLAVGAVLVFAAAVLGLVTVACRRLLAWWRAGQSPKGVRVTIWIS